MHKKQCRMLAVLLLMLMLLPQMAGAVPFNPSIVQENGAITISGFTQGNEPVNIIIQRNEKRYFIDTTQADGNGEYSFRTKLPEGKYECQITSDEHTRTVTLNSEQSKENDPAVVPPNPTQKQYATLSIDKKTLGEGYVLHPTKFEFHQGDTVWDLLKRVLENKGIPYDYSFTGQFNSVYVESIDGDGEFDHGPGSNWMYSVNGKFIQVGASKVELDDGDLVRWRYTTNYGEDIGGGSARYLPENQTDSADVTVTAKTDKHGNASATVDKDTVEQAIDAAIKTAKESKDKQAKKEVTLRIKADKDAKKVETTIPKNTVQKLKEKVDSVKLTTPLAELCLDKKVLATIAKQAERDVKITAEKVDISKNDQISEETKPLIGKKPVVGFSITSGKKTISQFEGKIMVTLPYKPKPDEDTHKLTVYYINDEGKTNEMLGAHYDPKCKGLVFETNHFSSFAVVYDENKAVFQDVKSGDWCYDAVNFSVANHLFNGTTKTTFSPNRNMTRAMFFTVLHRMSGDTTYIGGANWYTPGMEWAKANGVSDGSNPNGDITREQLIAMLWRYENAPKPVDSERLSNYSDRQDVSSWALEAMQWSHETGLMRGRTETILAPKGKATRAEVATVMMRFMENVT